MSKKIILTGGSGFVGKLLLKKLKKYGYDVINVDSSEGYNMTDWNEIKSLKDFYLIIHLAAKSYVPDSYINPYEFYESNVKGTLNMLELCRINNARMVFTSSYVYGIPHYLPIDEKHPLESLNPYSHTKILGESLCRSYYKNFNVPITILRPSNIYGIGQNNNFLIPTIINQLYSNRVELKDKNPKRDYIYVEDMVEAYIHCLEPSLKKYRVFNIGTGKSYSVDDIVKIIVKESKRNPSIKFSDSDRKNEVMDLIYDINHANKNLNWTPRFSIEEGIRAILINYNKNRGQ
jgi:nucleoside-diphosphate-sugar epimerase